MSRSYILNYVHYVFSTKNRIPSIKEPDRLWAYIRGIARNREFDLLAIGGTENHVHALIKVPSRRNLSDIIRDIKANSSRHLRLATRAFSWQDGYAAISVSPSQLQTVTRYISNQKEHHRVRSFEEEYALLLNKAGVTFETDDAFD